MRPATPLICGFIDEHKDRFGVVPICRALGIQGVAIAPRTYWAHRSSAPSKRALWDTPAFSPFDNRPYSQYIVLVVTYTICSEKLHTRKQGALKLDTDIEALSNRVARRATKEAQV